MGEFSFSFRFSCFLCRIYIQIAYKWIGWFADITSTFNFSFTVAKPVYRAILLFTIGVIIGRVLNVVLENVGRHEAGDLIL